MADTLGVELRAGSIADLVEATERVAQQFGYGSGGQAREGLVLENVQARVRGHLLSTFAALEGGVVCDACTRPSDIILIERRTVLWCSALIQSRFDEILTYEMDVATSFSLLHLAQLWIRTHTGRALNSLDFLFTTGLF